ncbi:MULTISPECIES: hypothetical protein [unclassified Streptomyces]|uniref:hypothetical protein n=1 Tax=unclassified Streptomyces TaxID=2593676 RepID=UPI0015BB87D9|nr:hypothetical protein [Streptomyces sp. NBRC 110465]
MIALVVTITITLAFVGYVAAYLIRDHGRPMGAGAVRPAPVRRAFPESQDLADYAREGFTALKAEQSRLLGRRRTA